MKKFARHDLNAANLRECENFSVAITNDCPAPMRKAPGRPDGASRNSPDLVCRLMAGGWLDGQVRQTASVFQSLESRAEFRVESRCAQGRPMG
jgi:hypothetical protein